MAVLFFAVATFAHNPIAVKSDGTPFKWASFPILYTVDSGNLGSLSNADANALATEAFNKWTSAFTASLSVTQNSTVGLGPDGDVDTLAEFNAISSASSCVIFNPVIYDSDGAVTDGLFGAGASDSTLGFAGPCTVAPAGVITSMLAVMNGKPFVSLPTPIPTFARSILLSAFIHEFGHALGLGHSQLNLNCLTNPASCPSDTLGGDILGVPTMFPFLLEQTESFEVSYAVTLSTDDVSAISTLYPSSTFATHFGIVSGIVFFGDGVNHFQGANVVARLVTNPRVIAFSNVSGMFAQADRGNSALGRSPSPFGSPDFTKRGEYTISGLTPGDYTVEIESVYSSFVGGSNVGPQGDARGANIPLPTGTQCLGGFNCQVITAHAGTVVGSNNFFLNDGFSALDQFDAVARNETIATATPLGSPTIFPKISANNGPDVDFYSIDVPSGQVFSARTITQPGPTLDTVLDLMDANGVRLASCRVGDDVTPFDRPCVNDDYIPTDGVPTLNSKLTYLATSGGTVYLRVSDALGDSRPDFFYTLVYSLAPAQAAVGFSASPVMVPKQFISHTRAVTVTVVNAGALSTILSNPAPASITGPDAADFALAENTTCIANLVLQGGASCVVNATFRPSAVGPRSANLAILHSASGSPQVVSFNAFGVDFTIELGGDRPGLEVPAATVNAGSPATFPVLVSFPGGGGLPASVTFAVSGLPPGAIGTFSRSLVPEGDVSTASVLTVATTIRSTTPPLTDRGSPLPPLFFHVTLSFSVALCLLTLLIIRSRTTRKFAAFTLLTVVLASVTQMSCSGGGSDASNFTAPPTSSGTGTPAGTSTLTITGTAGSLVRSTTVTLTVR